jgi:hypothetical protein
VPRAPSLPERRQPAARYFGASRHRIDFCSCASLRLHREHARNSGAGCHGDPFVLFCSSPQGDGVTGSLSAGVGRSRYPIGGDPGGADESQRSPNSTITAYMTSPKSERLSTPRSCGLQGVTPSARPYGHRSLGARRYSHGVFPSRADPRVSLLVFWRRRTLEIQYHLAPDVPRGIARAISACAGTDSLPTGLYEHTSRPSTFVSGQPSWSF